MSLIDSWKAFLPKKAWVLVPKHIACQTVQVATLPEKTPVISWVLEQPPSNQERELLERLEIALKPKQKIRFEVLTVEELQGAESTESKLSNPDRQFIGIGKLSSHANPRFGLRIETSVKDMIEKPSLRKPVFQEITKFLAKLNWVIIFALGFNLSFVSAELKVQPEKKSLKVLMGSWDGVIHTAFQEYTLRLCKEGESRGSRVIVLKLTTPGGSVEQVQKAIAHASDCKSSFVTWLAPAGTSATSAGALFAISTEHIFMAEGTRIGAASPVSMDGKDIEKTMKKKVFQDLSAMVRSLAEKNGKKADLLEKMVTDAKSYSEQEAILAGIASGRANTELELTRELGKIYGEVSEIESFEPGILTQIQAWVSNPQVAQIAWGLALILLFVEFNAPGVQVAGGLSALLFAVSLFSMLSLPTRTSGIVLIGLGSILLCLELLFTAHGALVVSGSLALGLGWIMLFDPVQTSLVIPWFFGAAVTALGVLFGFGMLVLIRKSRLAAAPYTLDNGGFAGFVGTIETVSIDPEGSPGCHGVLKIRGEIWSYESNDLLQVGDQVSVVKFEHFILTVSKA